MLNAALKLPNPSEDEGGRADDREELESWDWVISDTDVHGRARENEVSSTWRTELEMFDRTPSEKMGDLESDHPTESKCINFELSGEEPKLQ